MNAFCHQNYAIRGGLVNVTVYDDRLEVASSGLSPEKLFAPREHLPSNPRVARTLHLRGDGARNSADDGMDLLCGGSRARNSWKATVS